MGLLLVTYVVLIFILASVAVGAYTSSAVVAIGPWLSALIPHTFPVRHGSVQLSWATILGFTCLNAFFEETVYMGYLFNQCAAKSGCGIALIVTVLVRLAVHTYQGTEHVLQMGMWSLIFGLWYWRGGKVHSPPAVDCPWRMRFIDLCFSLGALKILFGYRPLDLWPNITSV